MDGKIWLSIQSIMKSQDSKADEYTFETEGKLYTKDDAEYLMYYESELSGMEGDKTVLKFQGNRCTMRRYGVHKSELVFEKGRKVESMYQTPYGNFEMTTLASEMVFDKTKGEAYIKYRLVIKGLSESFNELHIKFCEVK